MHPTNRAARAVLVALTAISAVVAHQVTYLVDATDERGYSRLMAETGHGYWEPLAAVVLAVVAGLTIAAVLQWHRLAARSRELSGVQGDEAVTAYARITLALWARLAALTMIVYGVQENLERTLSSEPVLGLEVLFTHGWLPAAAIAVATLLVAAVAGLFKWRRRVLLARLASATQHVGACRSLANRPPRSVLPAARDARSGGGIRAPPLAATSA